MTRRTSRLAGCLIVTAALLAGPAAAPAVAAPAVAAPTAAAPTAAGAAPVGAPGGPTRDRGGASDRLLEAGVRDLRQMGVTGVQGLARRDGRTDEARAGVANLETGAPVPRNGYFRMGSNTKTFAAVIVLQLVGEGRLSLDDTVERWLPGLVTGNGNDGSRITVRQVLQHTSGLYNYTNDVAGLSSEEGYLAHRFDHYEPAELVTIALKHEPLFAPGTRWDYSNTNYILAGMIIEKVTGRSWASALRDRILRPLGLHQTYSPGDRAHLRRPHANGYQQFTPDGPLVDTTLFNTTVAYAAGDLATTPADLARFWQAVQDGRLLRPAELAEMRRTVLAETFQDIMPGARYGLGIMWIPSRCGGYWGHGGDVPGMNTANGVTDDGDRVIVLSLTTQFADETGLAVFQRTNHLIEEVLCARR